MRKSIRPFVVETKKSRHDKPSTERALFSRLITQASEPAAPAPARDPFSPPGLSSHVVDPFGGPRCAPQRVLESLDEPETALERRIREADDTRRERRPALDPDALEDETDSPATAAVVSEAVKVTSKVKPARRVARSTAPKVQEQEPAPSPVASVAPAPEVTAVLPGADVGPLRKPAGKLPPSMRWAARLPRSVQDRMLARSKRRS